jgi:hypothetical protein
MIPDPELVKEVLSNKFGHFGKPRSNRIGRLLANGLVNHDGEKWAKHRRILNPAFHHEKIKVFSSCLFYKWIFFYFFTLHLCCMLDTSSLNGGAVLFAGDDASIFYLLY